MSASSVVSAHIHNDTMPIFAEEFDLTKYKLSSDYWLFCVITVRTHSVERNANSELQDSVRC